MTAPVNIYPAIVFKLNPRIKAYLDQLDRDRQIDRDQNGHPYLVNIDSNGASTYTVHIVRNGRIVNFIINTRTKNEPIHSWNPEDGYVRAEPAKQQVVSTEPGGNRRERERRTAFESLRLLVDQLLRG